MAERYFGRIPRGKENPPEMTTLPPKWEGELRYAAEADTNPQVEIRWHTVPFQHRDSYPLEVLETLLNGRTGRLYKALVDAPDPSKALATQAGGGQESRKYAGSFSVFAEAREGKPLDALEKGLLAEVERVRTELVPEHELTKVKNQLAASAYRRLTSSMGILIQLLSSDGLGDFAELNAWPAKVDKVTAEDVRRVARAYLGEGRAVATYTRKEKGPEKGQEKGQEKGKEVAK
jgi:predicted Zn-dependent peptidase